MASSHSRLNLIKVISTDRQSLTSQMALKTFISVINSDIKEFYSRKYNQTTEEYNFQPELEYITEEEFITSFQKRIENNDNPDSTFNPILFQQAMDDINAMAINITEDGMGDGKIQPKKSPSLDSKKLQFMNPALRDILMPTTATSMDEDYSTSFTGRKLGRIFLHSQVVTSTHTLMTGPLHQLPSHTVFVTDYQEKGRGRGGNTWTSNPGSLMVNMSLPVKSGSNLPFIQYLIGWAIVKAVTTIPSLEKLPIRIKWPNDIYIGDKKAGGIICQSSMIQPSSNTENSNDAQLYPADFMDENLSTPTFLVHAGFGINVTAASEWACINDAIRELLSKSIPSNIDTITSNTSSNATTSAAGSDSFFSSLMSGFGYFSSSSSSSSVESINNNNNNNIPFLTREIVLARTLYFLDGGIKIFNARGFAPFEREYLQFWLHTGARVRVEGHPNHCIIKGLSPSGFLRAQDEIEKDVELELHPDGNSFDLSQSFLKAKKL